jgi:undecaprenyl-diphosphatase
MKSSIERVHRFLFQLPVVPHLSIQLLVGLMVSIVCLWLFSAIAEDVVEKSRLVALDMDIANALHAAATPASTAVYRTISWIGLPGVWIMGVLVAGFFVSRKQRLHLAVWMIALGGGWLLNNILKTLFARPRPIFADPIEVAQNFSFPSGHAMMALIGYGLFTYFVWSSLRHRYERIVLIFVASLLIILIGISRLTLGVHYLSDVVAGFAAGGLWLAACITAMATIYRRKSAGDPAISEPTPSCETDGKPK